jgi:hypothetical protein
LQHERGDFGRRVLLVAAFDPGVAVRAFHDLVRDEFGVLLRDRVIKRAPDEALDGVIGVRRVGDGLARGLDADQALAAFGEGDNRRRGVRALSIDDHLRGSAFHHGDARVRRAQVDPDHFAHVLTSSFYPAARPSVVGTHSLAPPETASCSLKFQYRAARRPSSFEPHSFRFMWCIA